MFLVICRGKGDYYRLGHGTDEHVRIPKKVSALQDKKIISVATGSLHCVACTDAGEVYTWGDNDEGQLGDASTNAVQRPRLVTALQVSSFDVPTQLLSGHFNTMTIINIVLNLVQTKTLAGIDYSFILYCSLAVLNLNKL